MATAKIINSKNVPLVAPSISIDNDPVLEPCWRNAIGHQMVNQRLEGAKNNQKVKMHFIPLILKSTARHLNNVDCLNVRM